MLRNLGSHLNDGGIIVFDLNFLAELWSQKSDFVNMLVDGKKRYIQTFHRELEDGGKTGVSSSTITLFGPGGLLRSEGTSPHRSTNMLKMAQVMREIRSAGVKAHVYDGWNGRAPVKMPKETAIFVLTGQT